MYEDGVRIAAYLHIVYKWNDVSYFIYTLRSLANFARGLFFLDGKQDFTYNIKM